MQNAINSTETPSQSVKLSLRVSPDFRKRLRLLAAGEDEDMQTMVIRALQASYPELR